MKKVLSVYTHSMTTIYLSLSAQVAISTFFMKSPLAHGSPYSTSVMDRRATTSLSTSHKAHERPYYTYIVLPWPHTCNVRVVQGVMVGRVYPPRNTSMSLQAMNISFTSSVQTLLIDMVTNM